jgi:hypothetical protein
MRMPALGCGASLAPQFVASLKGRQALLQRFQLASRVMQEACEARHSFTNSITQALQQLWGR